MYWSMVFSSPHVLVYGVFLTPCTGLWWVRIASTGIWCVAHPRVIPNQIIFAIVPTDLAQFLFNELVEQQSNLGKLVDFLCNVVTKYKVLKFWHLKFILYVCSLISLHGPVSPRVKNYVQYEHGISYGLSMCKDEMFNRLKVKQLLY